MQAFEHNQHENDKLSFFGRDFSCANVSAYPFFGFTTAPKTPFSVASIAESAAFIFLLIFLLASYTCIHVKGSNIYIRFARRYTILPIFYKFIRFYLLSTMALVLFNVIAFYVKNRYIVYLAGGFCLFTSLEECISLFLIQQSGGRYHIRKAVRYSLIWGAFIGCSWTVLNFATEDSCKICKQSFWLSLSSFLFLFYLWILVSKRFPRFSCYRIEPRPAIYVYAVYIMLVNGLWGAANALAMLQYQSEFLCTSASGNFLYYLINPFVVYYTFYKDSVHWRTAFRAAAIPARLPINGDASVSEYSSLLESYSEDRNLNIIDFTRLKVQKKIASGSTATVYRGVLDATKDVAIKQFHCAVLEAEVIRKFIDEALLMSSVGRHENVVQYYGICIEPPDIRLVIEYCEAGSLFEILHVKQMRIAWSMKLRFALDCIKGLSYLHDRNIIHRDVKSLNYLVSKDWVVKIADFGQARKLDANVTMTANRGTIHWMAPEVLSKKRYSQQADVYSFGIVLYELYTQTIPFEDEPILVLVNSICRDGRRPEIPNECPAEYAELMKDCWERDSQKRPSASEIKDRLQKIYDMTSSKSVREEKIKKKYESGFEPTSPDSVYQ